MESQFSFRFANLLMTKVNFGSCRKFGTAGIVKHDLLTRALRRDVNHPRLAPRAGRQGHAGTAPGEGGVEAATHHLAQSLSRHQEAWVVARCQTGQVFWLYSQIVLIWCRMLETQEDWADGAEGVSGLVVGSGRSDGS